MALSINSVPNNIDNSAEFNITTDVAEDASHVNVRIRASIYHEGTVKAILEQPKGLPVFNFAEILKTLVPGIKLARDTGDIVNTGTVGSNLIAGWSGTYATFTSAANVISAAIDAALPAYCNTTPVIPMVAGELFVLYSIPYVSNVGTRQYDFSPSVSVIKQFRYATPVLNQGLIIMCTASGDFTLKISDAGVSDWSGTFFLYKITTDRDTIGSPLCPYVVFFQEYWENASGVTTAGADNSLSVYNNVFRFVPALGDDNAFTEYVMHDSTCFFANKTLRNNAVKFFTSNPLEYFVVFFTEYVSLELFYSKDGAAADHATEPFCYEGWGILIINVGEIMASVATSLAFYFKEKSAATVISETVTIYPDTLQIDERVVLEFIGLTGGTEYLAFEGLTDVQYVTERNYYKAYSRNRKGLSFRGFVREKIETLFKDMVKSEYLKTLLISDEVKKLEASYATPTEVTIITDAVRTDGGREMFTNTLEIEYEG